MAQRLTITCLGSGTGALFVDRGRPGHRARGIAGGGAADRDSAAFANRLLDQQPDHCCLEVTLAGGKWKWEGEGQIALTGAEVDWRMDDRPVRRESVLSIRGQGILAGGFSRAGCRAYVGIRGNWELPTVLGSVERGLPGAAAIVSGYSWSVGSASPVPPRQSEGQPEGTKAKLVHLRTVPGPEWELLSRERQHWLMHQSFKVGRDSNRQGIRLEGDDSPSGDVPTLLSGPVLPGTVQFTPSGPILLGPDAQTIGGYPRVLLVVGNLSPAFQLRPGEALRFRADL
ncbi:antagonist of KipI [Neolewinella xylanilytica]|uniref:Antagonist of KipI n=1 Tax=Neolewinella xylanilytica TaxID=1514080 RepID=A0A2S6I3U2_9BACT|nr:biotin-dependent carboxyltransferase family protein [Neolewinella xylanilytica]PPK85862.1 antagonist of KipI [Neolewinella xylanilytica]